MTHQKITGKEDDMNEPSGNVVPISNGVNDKQNIPGEETVSKVVEVTPEAVPIEQVPEAPKGERRAGGAGRGHRRGRTGDDSRRRRGKREERQRSEFDQKTLLVRRVARVVAGGRRFSFSAAIVAGDRKGRVGVGIGKGGDTALAIEKALRDAKRNMTTIRATDTMSIAHDVVAKESSATVSIRPAPNRGIVAGSAAKLVLELAGVRDVTAKVLSSSKNKLNIARATVKALSMLKK